jgi:ribosomal-protein-alanine N-acetyltransferase
VIPLLSLRSAVLADAAAIAEVFEQCLPDPWTDAMVEDSLRHGCRGLLAEDMAGGLEGVVLVQPVPPETEILQVAVPPALRRRGIGRRLLRGALALAASTGAEAVFLEVRPSNAGALALYESEGFERVGLRKGYYRNGEDAVLMRRPLRHPLPPPPGPP